MTRPIFTRLFYSFSGIPSTIWLLSAVSLINRIGTMVVAFMTLYLTQYLHYDIRDAGYVLTVYGIGSVVGQWLGGRLTDSLGYYRTMWLTLLIGGLLFFITMLFTNFWLVCLSLFILAISTEAFRPANQVAIKIHSSEQNRTRSFSLMRVAINLAVGLGLILGGFLIQSGWHWLFWVDGLTCFGAAILLRLYLKEKKDPLPSSTQMSNSPNTDISAYRDTHFLIFTIMTFVSAVVFMQLVWTVPYFFKIQFAWTEAEVGLANALNAAIVMLVEMPLVSRIDKKRPHFWFVQVGTILYGIAYLTLLLPPQYAWTVAAIYMLFISFGEIFLMPFSSSWATMRAPVSRQGQYMALYGMAYAVSNIFAPMIGTQVIAAYGFHTLWYLMAILSAITWLGFWYLARKTSV
jgi:MFS family permease